MRNGLPALALIGCLGCTSPRQGAHGPDAVPPRGLCCFHPVAQPPPYLRQLCHCLPPEARDCVHLFAINGADPLQLANLQGLCECVRDLGFPNADCSSMWQAAVVRDRIGDVRGRDPGARVVLLGFSAGAKSARRIAQELKCRHVPIDLLVYLGGDMIGNVPESRPENVGQVLNITGHGFLPRGGDLFFNGADLDGAANRRLDVRHMLLPTRPETVEMLVLHLVAVSQAPP
jgi:hypothetical protein